MNRLTQHLKTVLAAFFLLLACMASAQEFPAPMQPRRLVNDFTGMFSSQETARLEQKLRRFNDTTSTQIAIAVVPSLHGYAPNDYAQRLAEQWGIGQQGKDNGILILLKPKTRDASGQVAIAVGYGLEGVVPDAIASRIIRNEVIPAFQQGAYYAGIDRATTVLMQLTGVAAAAASAGSSSPSSSSSSSLPFSAAGATTLPTTVAPTATSSLPSFSEASVAATAAASAPSRAAAAPLEALAGAVSEAGAPAGSGNHTPRISFTASTSRRKSSGYTSPMVPMRNVSASDTFPR